MKTRLGPLTLRQVDELISRPSLSVSSRQSTDSRPHQTRVLSAICILQSAIEESGVDQYFPRYFSISHWLTIAEYSSHSCRLASTNRS